MPSWLIAIGTVAAAWSAVRALLRERNAATMRAEAEHDRAEREQAEKVTWWTDVTGATADLPIRPFADASGIDYASEFAAQVVLSNSSDDCIYEVSLQFPRPFGPVWLEGNFTDDDVMFDVHLDHLWRQIGVVPPGLTCFRVPVPTEMSPTQGFESVSDTYFNRHVEWIEFRDRNDVLWRRFGDGRLEKQPKRHAVTETAYVGYALMGHQPRPADSSESE